MNDGDGLKTGFAIGVMFMCIVIACLMGVILHTGRAEIETERQKAIDAGVGRWQVVDHKTGRVEFVYGVRE